MYRTDKMVPWAYQKIMAGYAPVAKENVVLYIPCFKCYCMVTILLIQN